MITSTDLMQALEALLQLSMMIMVGIYLIFSNTIMASLKQFDNGAQVMVTINKVILNPLFMACFIISGVAAVYFVFRGGTLENIAGLLFFIGTTLVTVVKNVPLNNLLRDTSGKPDLGLVWRGYLHKWLFWNHIRSYSAVASSFLMLL